MQKQDLNNDDSPLKSESIGNIGNQNVFRTPEGYFESLHAHISDKIHQKTQSPVYFRRVITIPVFIMILLAGSWFYFKNMQSEKVASPVLTYDYMVGSGLVYEFDESMLVEAYEEVMPENKSANGNNEAYQDYLMDNNTDITLIINEL